MGLKDVCRKKDSSERNVSVRKWWSRTQHQRGWFHAGRRQNSHASLLQLGNLGSAVKLQRTSIEQGTRIGVKLRYDCELGVRQEMTRAGRFSHSQRLINEREWKCLGKASRDAIEASFYSRWGSWPCHHQKSRGSCGASRRGLMNPSKRWSNESPQSLNKGILFWHTVRRSTAKSWPGNCATICALAHGDSPIFVDWCCHISDIGTSFQIS